MKKTVLAILACAAVCACTSEKISTPDVQKTFDGDVAYMTVRINDVGTTTRATEGNYANGSESEYAVSNAYFYFYDAAGVFVSQAEVWDGGEATNNETGKIEFEGSTVIVLKGLTGTGYPNYVVTVLNRPSGFTPGNTLSAMAELLADASGVGINDATGNFVMSTSSYVDGTADTRAAYFVTPVTEDDFFEEPIDMNKVVPVDIYVERLAAKVETGIATALADTATTLGDDTTGYPITGTVAGDPNDEGDSGSGEGDETLYVKITGWALNGTAKHSNIVKDITGLSTEGIDGWTGWNVPGDFRSYWGKSFNYGLGFGQYPTSSEGASNAAGSEKDGTTLNEWLDYVSYNDLALNMGGYEYCAENTNTAGGESGVIQTKNTSAITNVLVAAEVCDADGNGLDLVRYNGELFTEEAYLNYVLTELNALGQLDVYTLTGTATDPSTGETTNTYTQIDGSYVQLAKTDGKTSLVDGYVVVVPVDAAFDGVTFYTREGEEIDDAEDVVLAALQAFNAGHTMVNAYNGGAMYYSVPVEHLNNNSGTEGEVLEANYGIVRNHWYQLTVTSIENLGKGVFDPDEVIIPNLEDEKYYYVGAQINILSWKLVSQEVVF